MKSVGRQKIAGAEAASAAKSPVTDEKRKEAPPDGGPTDTHRMGLSLGHLSALRVPRRGSHVLFSLTTRGCASLTARLPRATLCRPGTGLSGSAGVSARKHEVRRTTDNSRSRSCVSSKVSGSRGKTYRSPAGWQADRKPPHGIEPRSSVGPPRSASGLSSFFSSTPVVSLLTQLHHWLLSAAPRGAFEFGGRSAPGILSP